MKKKILLPILLLATMSLGGGLIGCNKKPAESQTSTQSQYKVAIDNKAALEGEWYEGDAKDLELTLTPEANPLQELNSKNLTVTSSDESVVKVTGLGLSALKAGTAKITVDYRGAKEEVNITILSKSAKAKYGAAHEGTAEDPFTNEDALLVAKSEKYGGEVYYVKGKVASFYNAPGSRDDGMVAFYLEPAEGKTEKFEIYKCFKADGGKLTDDDIWVGGEVTAYGAFTVYGTQYETSSAVFVKCEGNKPQPRQTLTKTFAEVLTLGAALPDGGDSYDYIKFEGFVTEKSGNDYFLTATKGEALTPGKSDEAHGAKDIKGTNAIELYGAGKVEALNAKLLKNAKVEVTMVVKNYHGTIENGLNLTDADVTVKTAGEPWVINYQDKTVAEALTVINALEDGKTAEGYYAVTGVVAAVTTAYSDQYKNISFTIGDTAADTNLLTCFRVGTDAETAAKIVAGAKVIVKGQLQKYVKDGAMTPELINGKVEIVPEHVVTYTTVGSLSFNKDATVVIDNKLDQASDPFINYASTSGVAITVRKNTSSSDVNVWKADYASCRWYVGHKVNIAHANEFDRVVLTCDSGYDAFKPEADGTTIAALKAAGITYASEGGKITLDLATAAKSVEIVIDKQIRPSNVELLKSNAGGQTSNITFKWGDAIQEGSSALDGAKFNKNATYNLKVENVPAAGTYVLTLPMMGSDGNATRTFCTTGTDHDGQGFSIAVGETAGTIIVAGKTYAEVFGESQTTWVDVAFAEVALAQGTNIITLKTTGAGYRVSINVNSDITLAPKA